MASNTARHSFAACIVLLVFIVQAAWAGGTLDDFDRRYQWDILVRIAGADSEATLKGIEKGNRFALCSKRLFYTKLFEIGHCLPSGRQLSQMIPNDEGEFAEMYDLGVIAILKGEKGEIREADADAISLLSDQYFEVLLEVVLKDPRLLKKWVRMRRWAMKHPDIKESIDGWDERIRSGLGDEYERMLQKEALDHQRRMDRTRKSA